MPELRRDRLRDPRRARDCLIFRRPFPDSVKGLYKRDVRDPQRVEACLVPSCVSWLMKFPVKTTQLPRGPPSDQGLDGGGPPTDAVLIALLVIPFIIFNNPLTCPSAYLY
jgi:hypothetical protein